MTVAGMASDQGVAGINQFTEREKPSLPDVVLRVNARKSASFTYKGTYGEVTYGLGLSGVFIDPYTQRMLSEPRIKDIQRYSKPERYVLVNGQYYTGFNISDRGTVAAEYQQLANDAFRLVVNAVLNYSPSGGRVVALHGDRFELDRGSSRGIQSNESMIVFVDDGGLAEPIASARVQGGVDRSSGVIQHWKPTPRAAAIKAASVDRTLTGDQLQIFAVSVGAPQGYEY